MRYSNFIIKFCFDFSLSPENTEVLTEIGVLYLKLNETQKAFDRLLEVIQFDKYCLRGLMAFGAILQVRTIFFMVICLTLVL